MNRHPISLKFKVNNTPAKPTQPEETPGSYYAQTTTLDGWLTSIDKTDFVCIQPQGEDNFYHYAIAFNHDRLIANDVTFFDAELDSIHSTADFRAKVVVGMQRETWRQGETTWVRQ